MYEIELSVSVKIQENFPSVVKNRAGVHHDCKDLILISKSTIMKTLTILLLFFTLTSLAEESFLVTVTHKSRTTVHRVTDFNHVNDMIELRFSFRVDKEKVFAELREPYV